MREVGSVWFVYSTTLLEPAKGETDDLECVTKRLALVLYTLFPTHSCLGSGQDGKWRTGGRGLGLLGNPSHPWSGVYGAVLGQTVERTYPR